MHIHDLVIEVTRRCQLECEHCLRGDKEDIDIWLSHIREMLVAVESVGTVTFTGGEPFLFVDAIDEFISICEENNIVVDSFFIATNGIIFEKRNSHSSHCLITILNLHCLCEDNEYSAIRISNTPWHGDNITPWNRLHSFSFAHEEGADWDKHSIIAEGRGHGIHGASRTAFNPDPTKCPEDLMVCLNVHGEILFECNLSYDTQAEEGISIDEGKAIIRKCAQLLEEEYA